MKSSSSFQLLNKKEPKIYLEYELLQQIKYIVKVAPKEAQWFHRLSIDVDGDFCLEEMYIPEQTCSSVEVDTDSMMMVNFYKELLSKNGPEKTNTILSELNCWCHSHHNMGTSPSGQDVKQFGDLIKQSIDQKTNNPVIMLIFNKRDEYYCRAYDPSTGNIYEGLEISVYAKDYKWIDEEAKIKFKEPVIKVPVLSSPKTTTLAKAPVSTSYYWDNSRVPGYTARNNTNTTISDIWELEPYSTPTSKGRYLTETKKVSAAMRTSEYVEEVFGRSYSSLSVITKASAESLADVLFEELESQERFIVNSLLKRQTDFFDKAKKLEDKSGQKKAWMANFVNLLMKQKRTVGYVETLLITALEMFDQLELDLKDDFVMWADDFYALEEDLSPEPKSSYTPLKR